MKIIANLTMDNVIDLVDNGKISNMCVIPLNETLKKLVKQYLEENTGFDEQPVLAVCRVQGSEGLKESWANLDSFIAIEEGNILVEFDMPDDMVATISYEQFLAMNNKSDFLPYEVNDSLKLEKHGKDDNELAFLPRLIFKYCTGYKQVGPDWESEDCQLDSPSEINKLVHFKRSDL